MHILLETPCNSQALCVSRTTSTVHSGNLAPVNSLCLCSTQIPTTRKHTTSPFFLPTHILGTGEMKREQHGKEERKKRTLFPSGFFYSMCVFIATGGEGGTQKARGSAAKSKVKALLSSSFPSVFAAASSALNEGGCNFQEEGERQKEDRQKFCAVFRSRIPLLLLLLLLRRRFASFFFLYKQQLPGGRRRALAKKGPR